MCLCVCLCCVCVSELYLVLTALTCLHLGYLSKIAKAKVNSVNGLRRRSALNRGVAVARGEGGCETFTAVYIKSFLICILISIFARAQQ